MIENVLSILRCPNCGSVLEFQGKQRQNARILEGLFVCTQCPSTFKLNNGVAFFAPSDLNLGTMQTQNSFTSKWQRVPTFYDEGSFPTQFQRDWYLRRYHWKTEDSLKAFLKNKKTILDTGCGVGKDIRWYAKLQPNATVIGLDISEGAVISQEKANAYPHISVIQADLNKPPFTPETFDFVACDQVLPNVEFPFQSIAKLWSLVKPGGHFAFYLYKEKAPIREAADDLLREKITHMNPPEAWETCIAITRLGKALSDLNVEFEVPLDIPLLGIQAGRYNLQRFLYYHFLKSFWNDGWNFDENNIVNYDWYHPPFTHRNTVQDVEKWIKALEMNALVVDADEPSGISVLAEKH